MLGRWSVGWAVPLLWVVSVLSAHVEGLAQAWLFLVLGLQVTVWALSVMG